MSLCGITSVFLKTIDEPRVILTACAALIALPLTDHVWQPLTWWRMVS
jgi:hypothetical protein